MIGTLASESKSVAVIGAGISGLLSAYYLDRAGYEVHLYEKERRPGGLIRTTLTPFGIAESAAHSLLATDAVRSLFEDLEAPLVAVHPQSRARYVFRSRELRRFPLSFRETIDLIRRATTVKAQQNDELKAATVAEWASQYLGEGALHYLINPFVAGIFAASPEELSMRAIFPDLVARPGETVLKSVFRAKRERRQRTQREMVAPRDGMGALVAALERRLRNRLGERFITSAQPVSLANFKNRVLCVDAATAGELISSESPALASQLKETKYAPLVSVTAFVRRSDFTKPIRGVGVLIPERENLECLGILFNSSSFSDRVRDTSQHESFTVMFGGTRNPKWPDSSDFSIRSATKRALQDILSLRNEPVHYEIHRWKRAIPIYDSHLEDVWELARTTWCLEPGNILFGNYAGQVSVRGMIDSASRNFGTNLPAV